MGTINPGRGLVVTGLDCVGRSEGLAGLVSFWGPGICSPALSRRRSRSCKFSCRSWVICASCREMKSRYCVRTFPWLLGNITGPTGNVVGLIGPPWVVLGITKGAGGCWDCPVIAEVMFPHISGLSSEPSTQSRLPSQRAVRGTQAP